jgi:hypothetical protein
MSQRGFRISGPQFTVNHLLLATGYAALGIALCLLYGERVEAASVWLIQKVARPQLLMLLFLVALHKVVNR